LPDGQTLHDAIDEVDAATDEAAAYFMINCAHPTHFADVLAAGGAWRDRIGGLVALPDGRVRRDAEQPSPLANNAQREGVVVAEGRFVREASVRSLCARSHLVRRFARVREDQLLVRSHSTPDQCEKTLDDHPRLAAARTREHQARAFEMIDGFLLLRVQSERGGGQDHGCHRSFGHPGSFCQAGDSSLSRLPVALLATEHH